MALERLNQRRVHLGGPLEKVDDFDYEASAAITPGFLVEFHEDSSQIKVRPNGSTTRIPTLAVALDRAEGNKTIDDDYAIGDELPVGFLAPGSVFLGVIPSGQDISRAELLQSDGTGKLRTASAETADAGLARFQSLDNPGSVTEDTRIRVQVIN